VIVWDDRRRGKGKRVVASKAGKKKKSSPALMASRERKVRHLYISLKKEEKREKEKRSLRIEKKGKAVWARKSVRRPGQQGQDGRKGGVGGEGCPHHGPERRKERENRGGIYEER